MKVLVLSIHTFINGVSSQKGLETSRIPCGVKGPMEDDVKSAFCGLFQGTQFSSTQFLILNSVFSFFQLPYTELTPKQILSLGVQQSVFTSFSVTTFYFWYLHKTIML